MINPKPKRCSVCGELRPLWKASPKLCKECAMKLKVSKSEFINEITDKLGMSTYSPPKKYQTTAIKKVSTRQQKLNAAYMVLRNAFMKAHPICMAQWEGCTYHSSECHHAAGRTGGLMLDSTKFKALCNNCHTAVGLQSDRAKACGLSEDRLINYNL